MKRIHIALVGEQPISIYKGIVAINPDIVVYIYSSKNLKILEQLRKCIKLPEDEQPALDSNTPVEIKRIAEQLAAKYQNDDVTLDISSGQQSWSYLFGITFDKLPNASVINFGEDNVLWNYHTMSSYTDLALDMPVLFSLYGSTPFTNNYRTMSDYTESDKASLNSLKEIYAFDQNLYRQIFVQSATVLRRQIEQEHSGTFCLDNKSSVSWEKKNSEHEEDRVLFHFSSSKGEKDVSLNSKNAISLALDFGWFQYEVGSLLSEWERTKHRDTNLIFNADNDTNGVKIIVNAGTKILFVDCKVQKTSTTDIDNFSKIIHQYKGLDIKGLFVSDVLMTSDVITRCQQNGIIPFSLKSYKKGDQQQALFNILERELFGIINRRKLFISFLGSSNYKECIYVRNQDNFKSPSVRYVQEATLGYLTSKFSWTSRDMAYILLTEDAEKKNWNDNGHIDRETHEPIQQPGLKTELDKLKLPFLIQPIKNLPIGQNEDEIWKIFSRVFDLIQEGDELFFDLTHGFRYLPMLILVLANYAKFLKNVSIKSITYGNFESKNPVTQEAPIIDITTLSNLQDWTSAAASFLLTGNVKMLQVQYDEDYKRESCINSEQADVLKEYLKALNRVVEDFNICRGQNILESANIKNANELSEKVTNSVIEPMTPIIQKLKESFKDFSSDDKLHNGYAAAKWCYENKMYQQSLTILQETMISHICYQHNLRTDIKSFRDLVRNAFNCNGKKSSNSSNQQNYIHKIVQSELFKKLNPLYSEVRDLRNDFNHCGMIGKQHTRENLITRLRQCIEQLNV